VLSFELNLTKRLQVAVVKWLRPTMETIFQAPFVWIKVWNKIYPLSVI
jgi:hypothetical protein